MSLRPDSTALPRRLRELRKQCWPDRPLTQQELADAFGVVLSNISSWESHTTQKVPPPSRLAQYARFFATRRSLEPAIRLLPDDELNDAERAERDRLAAELEQLRGAALGITTGSQRERSRSLWRFPDDGPVRIICGPNAQPPTFASAEYHNYVQLSSYADLDALVELHGHVRRENPESDVQYELASRLEDDDLPAHLVLLGSAWVNSATKRIASLVNLPVRQVDDPQLKTGEIFETVGEKPQYFRPRFVDGDPEKAVIEDVGMFFRAPNPNNVARTLTICSGVFTRGVYGAVRFLTDGVMREENHWQLATIFGDANSFGLLMRVRVFDHATSTPDLRRRETILFQWVSTD